MLALKGGTCSNIVNEMPVTSLLFESTQYENIWTSKLRNFVSLSKVITFQVNLQSYKVSFFEIHSKVINEMPLMII